MTLAAQSETLLEASAEDSRPPEVQAAAVVLAYLDNTQLAVRHKAFEVLKELATQTVARALEGKSIHITTLNLKTGVAPDIAKDPSAWLSPHWARLIEAEKEWREGMIAAARRERSEFIPRLEKLQGNPSTYRILADPLPHEGAPEPVSLVPEGGIYYTPESITAPGAWLSKALNAGIVPWTAAARWSLMLTVMTGLIAVLILAWLLLYFGMRVTRPLSPADVTTVFVFLMLIAGVASVFRFFGELFDLRIVMAPSLLTPLSKDNVTLELRPSTVDAAGELVFARYTSTCPICNASVELFDGGKDFPGRIVGRCRRSAREHVYSFDHARKIGRPLRESAN